MRIKKKPGVKMDVSTRSSQNGKDAFITINVE